MRNKKLPIEKVDDIVGDAYELGFVHARNPYVHKSERVDEGWIKYSRRIKRFLRDGMRREGTTIIFLNKLKYQISSNHFGTKNKVELIMRVNDIISLIQ